MKHDKCTCGVNFQHFKKSFENAVSMTERFETARKTLKSIYGLEGYERKVAKYKIFLLGLEAEVPDTDVMILAIVSGKDAVEHGNRSAIGWLLAAACDLIEERAS